MTDLEMVKACAEAMGITLIAVTNPSYVGGVPSRESSNVVAYDPLHDDAQAMALVKMFDLTLRCNEEGVWCVDGAESSENDPSLNRAICHTVAKMQKEKK